MPLKSRRKPRRGLLIISILLLLSLTCCGGCPMMGGLGFVGYKLLAGGRSRPDKPDVPAPSEPSADMQTAVAPLKQFAGKEPSTEVAEAFRKLAWAVEGSELSTVQGLQSAIERFDSILFARVLSGQSLPGFSAALTESRTKALGATDGKLDKAKAVDWLNAVAWAVGGGQ